MNLYPTHKIVQEILSRKNKQIICNNLNSLLNNSFKVASNVIKSVKKAMISCATPSSLINQLELTKDNEMFAQQHILQLVTTIIVGINYFNAFKLCCVFTILTLPFKARLRFSAEFLLILSMLFLIQYPLEIYIFIYR